MFCWFFTSFQSLERTGDWTHQLTILTIPSTSACSGCPEAGLQHMLSEWMPTRRLRSASVRNAAGMRRAHGAQEISWLFL